MAANSSAEANSIWGRLVAREALESMPQHWAHDNLTTDQIGSDYFDSDSSLRYPPNLTLTLDGIRSLLNPDNYPSSIKAARTTRNLLIIAFYSSIVLVSLFGNLLVCYVILKRKRMRISTNLLMTNLAVSDLLMTVINIPFNIARILLNEWPFGSALCVFVPLVQVTSVYVSTLTMTIIAIDRYQAIINPLDKRLSTSVPISIIVLVIWVASAIFAIPNVAFNRVVQIYGHKRLLRCRTVYPQPEISYRQQITLFTFLTQYAIPLSITAFAYIRISFYIWRQLHQHTEQCQNSNSLNSSNEKVTATGHSGHNDSMENSIPSMIQSQIIQAGSFKRTCFYQASIAQLRERSRRKTIKMLAIVVGVFAICWLPLNIYHLNADFFTSNRIVDPNIFFICHWFAMSSVCYNPFIYFWLNRHYRQEIKHLIRCTGFMCFQPKDDNGMSPMHGDSPKQQDPQQPIRKHLNEIPNGSSHRNQLQQCGQQQQQLCCNETRVKYNPDKSPSCKVVFRTRYSMAPPTPNSDRSSESGTSKLHRMNAMRVITATNSNLSINGQPGCQPSASK